MYVCVFIDWENVEKTIKNEFGSIMNYEELVKVISRIATSNGARLVGIHAYGDFDRGISGLMSRLVNLGVEPKHIVTKTAQEYLKGSTDIELSLDILETMYTYPHINDFVFVSDDSDLRYVIKRLRKQGKNIRLIGFEKYISQLIIDMANEIIFLDKYPNIMRKVTQTEKEQRLLSLFSDEYVRIIIEHVDRLEKLSDKNFIGLNYLRSRLINYYQDSMIPINDALQNSIDFDILNIYQVQNPNDPKHPTRACKLNRENKMVQYVLDI